MSRVRTDLHALSCLAFLAMLGQAARAEPGRASLTVTRDDGSRECPDSPTLAGRVETVAGKRLFDAADAEPRDTWVQVEFVRSISGFHAVISARGNRQGTRTLDDVGPDCASLADAVAVTLAILLDPATAGASDPPPLAAPTPAVVAPVVAPRAVAPPPSDSPAPPAKAPASQEKQPTNVVGLDASTGPSFAMLEGVVPFVEAGVRARLGNVFAIGGGGGVLFPARIEFGEGSVSVSLTYGYARACANLLPKSRSRLEACLEPMLGGLRGSGQGYDHGNDAQWLLWSAAAATAQAYGPITESVLWSIRGRILAPLARHGFSVDQGGTSQQAFQLSAVGGSIAFGVEAEL